jgi:hypothetical protein
MGKCWFCQPERHLKLQNRWWSEIRELSSNLEAKLQPLLLFHYYIIVTTTLTTSTILACNTMTTSTPGVLLRDTSRLAFGSGSREIGTKHHLAGIVDIANAACIVNYCGHGVRCGWLSQHVRNCRIVHFLSFCVKSSCQIK